MDASPKSLFGEQIKTLKNRWKRLPAAQNIAEGHVMYRIILN